MHKSCIVALSFAGSYIAKKGNLLTFFYQSKILKILHNLDFFD